MSTAVLMTCHNRVETTLACLSRLIPQLGDADKVFLVDDGSTDGTGAKVRAKYPTVRVIDGDGTLYWAKGMHLAWETAAREADWDAYLWLNDDVMLKPEALYQIKQDVLASGAPDAVVVGGCSQTEEETVCSYGATDSKDVKISPDGKSPQPATGWFTGNCVYVSREAYKKVGMISGDYRHARADYDYAERLRRNGGQIYASSQYVGICECDFDERIKGKPLKERLCWLIEPSYFNLHDMYLFKSRFYGHVRAVLSCLHLIMIVLRMK